MTLRKRFRQQPSASLSRKQKRRHLLETLEPRQLLAGPQLIGVQPNEGDLIDDGAVRSIAPRSLTFRFDEAQQIDPATFAGIQITRAGSDGAFGTADDVRIEPGLVTLGDIRQNEVVVRFAENLPDDHYRIDVFAFDDPTQGIVALRNIQGEALQPSSAGARAETINFELNLGALVEAVVPQPVVRLEDGSLQQRRNEILVYFNEDELFVENDPATGLPTERSVEHPRFYQLLLTQETVRTTDDTLYFPERVIYDAASHTARLIFETDINNLPAKDGLPGVPLGGGTFRLRIGPAVDSRDDLILEPTRLVPGAPVGDTLGTALDLNAGNNFVTDGTQTSSIIIEGEISPVPFNIQYPGGANDPGRVSLPEVVGGGLLQSINAQFGPDSTYGVTEIAYNFQSVYATSGGNAQLNQITERQRTRIREALSLWGNYLGVQFRETRDQGITFAVGNPAALPSLGLQTSTATVRNALNASLRIDPTFTNSAMVFSNETQFNTAYGEDFFRKGMAGIGFLLGLEQSTEVTQQSLMALSNAFLNQTINPTLANGSVNLTQLRDLEPSFPSNLDILHGQHVHRPDSIDVNLYRFEVNLGAGNRTGTFTAETFAERLPDSSLLDSSLRLFRETRAAVVTNLGLGTSLSIGITAVQSGVLGNNARIDFIRTNDNEIVVRQKNDASGNPIVNAIEVQVPRTGVVTAGDLIAAINNHPFASTLFQAELLVGAASTNIVGATLDAPLLLTGGGIEELARNDDYYSNDSFLTASLGNGIYYIGVAASGNDRYDPQMTGSGEGGRTQGKFELALKFEPQVGVVDTIRDLDSERVGVPGTALDGDGDGIPGGAKNFWFQTRPTERLLEVTTNGAAIVPGQTFTLVGANGASRRFEFVPINGTAAPGNIAISYNSGSSGGSPTPASSLAAAIRSAINTPAVRTALGIEAVAVSGNSTLLELRGERSIRFSEDFRGVTAFGRTVFVDKVAGVNADGSLARPFNNIANPAVPNAFDSVSPNDIVRIVGNGGQDGDVTTVGDNFSYKIGTTETGGGTLEDGRNLLVPQGVTVMIDGGAALKLRNSAIVVGSTSLLADRSGGALQVLGTPRLVDLSDPVFNGTTVVDTGVDLLGGSGSVVFTSTRDRTVDAAAAGSSPVASEGNWGGIIFRRDLDQSQGRFDLEDEGIFLQTVNHADIRFGGGSNVLIESIQQTVNPIQMVNLRPNVTFNRLTRNAGAAMSASPDSFEETSYQSPAYQQAGEFTADYGRVGPDIKNNQLSNNSINGLFIRAETTPNAPLRQLTVAGRLDDIDIVHYVAENIIIAGNPGGSIQDGVRPQLADVAEVPISGGGVLAAGNYRYQVTFVDRFGFESLAAAAPTSSVTVTANSAIELFNLPAVPSGSDYISRRLYRQAPGSTEFVLVAELDASTAQFIDDGRRSGTPLDESRQGVRGRLNASLVIDPGTVVKFSGARIELGHGTQLLAEGLPGLPVVFTSAADDRFGTGGSFDTNNDAGTAGGGTSPARGDWAGIYAGPTAHVSLDNAVVAYGGGVSLIEGGQSKAFSALELHQATARVTNSRFEYNANGQGGAGPVGRNGRLGNTPSTIFARFTQPILVGNQFVENRGAIIDIDSDSLVDNFVVDLGRQTGALERLADLDDNHGPMVRRNTTDSTPSDSAAQRQLNGMYIRGGILSTSSVWDDTDIVHMVFDTISVGNQISGGELRLQSRPDESLVIKLAGSGNPNSPTAGTGFTATGSGSNLADRIGGALHVIGLPGAPVVMTSMQDDTVGAGRKLDGSEQTDTNGDGFGSRPFPNDWRGLYLDQYSNDRNVAVIPEMELSTEVAPGLNATVSNAQFLGELAESGIASDDRLRLGFEVHGFLSGQNDVDTYSFTGAAGTSVWLDIDKTSIGLDSVIEVLDSAGNVLARSDNSFDEIDDPSLIAINGTTLQGRVGPLSRSDESLIQRGELGLYEDFGSTNTRDAGLNFVLPGPNGTRSVYYIRVRSGSVNPADATGGMSRGGYSFQVRLQEAQEFPGSVVRFADIRYANHGIHLRGLPGSSPLMGEVAENESVSAAASNNSLTGGGTLASRPQHVGNLASTQHGTISIAGALSSVADIDFFQFEVNFGNAALSQMQRSTVFDIDYADDFSRPDTNISVFYDDGSGPRLVLFGTGSNIAEDQSSPLGNEIGELLARGSIGNGDPFIGPVSLPQGTYYVAVTEASRVPVELESNPLLRREPLDSVLRIFEDHVQSIGGSTARPPREGAFIANVGPGWSLTTDRANDPGHQRTRTFNGSRAAGSDGNNQSYHFDRSVVSGTLQSNAFDLTGYSAADLPRLYFNYFYDPSAGDNVLVRARSDQNQAGITLTSNLQGAPDSQTWRQQVISLESFAGHTGIVVEFVYQTGGGADVSEGLYLDDFIVGFAERGEMISQASPGAADFTTGFGAQAGEYQLEIRPGTEYATPVAGGLNLNETYDTNDRHARQVTLVAPAGSQINNGDRFTLNDGATTITFEFNTAGGFSPNVVRIAYSPTDTAAQIAQRLIDTINSSVVQASLRVKAAPASSNGSMTTTDARVNLTGTVNGDFDAITSVTEAPATLTATPRSGGGRNIVMPAIMHNGTGDSNTVRTQSQIIIDSNRISDSHGIGIWSEATPRLTDPRDGSSAGFQTAPPIGNTGGGVAKNLPNLNDSVIGGLVPGVVVVNNIVDQAGYAGIKIDGQTRPFMIDIPSVGIADGHTITIDAAGTRVVLEFEDVSGVPTNQRGSGQQGGDGFVDGHIPIYYRAVNDAGGSGQYPAGGRNTPSTPEEILVGIQQAINGSILVTNNIVGLVRASVGPSATSPSGLALYLEGASGVYFSGNFQKMGGASPRLQQAPIAEAPQPFARIVNNTIYGNDGTESQFAGSGADEPNDTLAGAVDTKLGRSHKGAYVTQGVIGDNASPLAPDRDVDLYKVELDVGDRLVVDIDTLDLGPGTVLRLFDSSGVAQEFVTGGGVTRDQSVPGAIPTHLNPGTSTANQQADEANSRDGYIDFTATKKGTYYVGVSSLGNDEYDPLSLAGRKAGIGGTGAYTLGMEVYAPRDFVLSVDNGNNSFNGSNTGTRAGALIGTTFTITQIPDYVPAGGFAGVNAFGNRVTFEFTDGAGGVVLPNGNINVPLYTGGLNGGYRVPDIMRAIAAAIARTSGGTVALPNHQQGAGPEGRNGPVPRVTALALGGSSGDNASINTTSFSDYSTGYGHNRLETGTTSVGVSGLSDGGGTSELYVLVQKAARIEISAAAAAAGLRLTPDHATPAYATEADQLLAETGVLMTQGASPTVVNNVFVNVHQSVVAEETNSQGFGSLAQVNQFYKTQQIVVTGNAFQYGDSRNTRIRVDVTSPVSPGADAGISTDGTSNVNGGNTDFNFVAPTAIGVLENPAGDRFTPSSNSPIIDSAINSLGERDTFGALKQSVGIPISNLLAPDRDNSGQLRADNPNVASPGGLGSNVFKDRGALDLADFVGPTAIIESPRDNDAAGIDTDPAESFLQLNSGIYDEFRILLQDVGDASDPFVGSGIDDDTVVVPVLPGLREAGANVALFEGDRLLTEGVDYTFSYDATRGLITLRPIAGVWRDDRAYRISINNRDRLVTLAPSAGAIADGDSFLVVDNGGGRVTFEFESGYELRIPETLRFTVPRAGTGAGGISDGTRFSLTDSNGTAVFFEFDRDGVTLPGSRIVSFQTGDSPETIAQSISAAIQAAVDAELLDVTPVVDGRSVIIGSEAGTILDASRTAMITAAQTIALSVPTVVAGPGGIADGEILTISDGNQTIRFEFDSNGSSNPVNTPINISGLSQADSVRNAIAAAIADSPLRIEPLLIGELLFLNLPANGSANVVGGSIATVGISRTPADGSTITFTPATGSPVTLVLDRTDDDQPLPSGIRIEFDRATTADQLAQAIAAAIRSQSIDGVDSAAVLANTGGQVAIGGEPGLGLELDADSTLQIAGAPGVSGPSQVIVSGPLLLQLPIVGGSAVPDDSQFTLTDGLNTVTFQYNLVLTGASNPQATEIVYRTFDDVEAIAAETVAAINAAGLEGITAVNLGGGRISLGNIDQDQFGFPEPVPPLDPDDPVDPVIPAPLSPRRGIVNDGEQIVITQGNQTLRFEFDAATGGGGVTPGFIPVVFQPGSTVDDVASVLAAAINNNRGNLNLSAAAAPGGVVQLNDTSQTVIDVSAAPTLSLAGTPGGAVPVRFNGAYGPEEMKRALIEAINQANSQGLTSLVAENRGGGSLFIENALLIDGPIDNYFLQAVRDLAGNPLKPNRPDNTTQFTLLLPTVGLDYGDAPDPHGGVPGRYPTQLGNDGARHVVDPNGVRLGRLIDIDADGVPTPAADGDDTTIFVLGSSGSLFDAVVRPGYVELSFNLTGSPTDFDGNTITLSTGVDSATLEFDVDGLFNENNFAVSPTDPSSLESIAQAFAAAVRQSPLRPADVVVVGNTVRVITNDEDGVIFTSDTNPFGVLNPGVPLEITVTVTGSGVLEGWIDFNFDGDWDDPNEQIISAATPGAIFVGAPNGEPITRTITIMVPATAPRPNVATTTYARFRVSTEGGLSPRGLALSGEVEDYALTILPGLPPDVNENNRELSYSVDEDGILQARDADGSLSPNLTNDNGILAQIQDPDGDEIAIFADDVGTRTLVDANGVVAGELTLFEDGTFSFVPTPDYFGIATFTARVTDLKPAAPNTQLVSAIPLTVNISVEPINDAPFVSGTAPITNRTVAEDTVVTFTAAELTGFYLPGPPNESNQGLVIQSAGVGGTGFQTELGGTVQIVDGNLRYTPPANVSGVDRFNYVVADAPLEAGQISEAAATLGTVVITLTAVNDAPIVNNDTFAFEGDGPFVMPIGAVGVSGSILGNDLPGPPDEVAAGQTISLVTSEFPKMTLRGGTVSISGSNLVYTPPANFSGPDQFTYSVQDNGSPAATATGTVFLTVDGDNAAPVFVGINGDPQRQSLQFNESKAVEQVFEYNLNSWFFDAEGDASTFTVTSSDPSTVNATVIFDPATGASTLRLRLPSYRFGEVTLTVVATNVGGGPSGSAQIPVTVLNTPDPPVLIGTLDPLNVNEANAGDPPVTRDLSTVFSDPDGGQLTYTVARIGNILNPTPGQIAASGLVQSITFVGNQMRITLVPDASGSVGLEIRASDGTFSVTDTFTLNVSPVADAPRGEPNHYNVPIGGTLQVLNPAQGVLANDTDPDNDVFPGTNQKLRVDLASVTQPSRGTLQMNSDGTFVYINTSGQSGDTDSFTYRPIDPTGLLGNVTTVTLNLGQSLYQNPIPGSNHDVNADGVVSPLDALLVLNVLAANRTAEVPVSSLTSPPPPYYDVNGDGRVQPLDALLVINEIARRNRLRLSSGEGELDAALLASSTTLYAASSIGLPETLPAEPASVAGPQTVFADAFDGAWIDFDEPAELLAEDHLSLQAADQDDDPAANAVDKALLSMIDLINLQ